MKRILFLAEEVDTNGAMSSLLALLRALPKDKYDVSLFLFKHGGKMMEQLPKDITLLPESFPYFIHRAPLRQAIKSSLKAFRFDMTLYRILVAFQRFFGLNYNLWSFLPAVNGQFDVACCYTDGFVAPMMLRKVKAARKCSWIHLPYTRCKQMPYVYDALRKMDVCVPVSIDTGRDLDRVFSQHLPQHVVHNITDAEVCMKRASEISVESSAKERKDGVFRIVSVGRVTPPKFFDIIPSVAELLNSKGLNYEWYIVGNGDKYDELLRETREKGLDNKVYFIGARSNPMPWIMSADVFVNPSRFEAWGMTVSEALCLGKAVIVSDIPVFKEQITDGVNGIVRKVTPEKLADAIMMLADDEELRHKLEQNARKYPFTKERIVQEFNQLMDKLS